MNGPLVLKICLCSDCVSACYTKCRRVVMGFPARFIITSFVFILNKGMMMMKKTK